MHIYKRLQLSAATMSLSALERAAEAQCWIATVGFSFIRSLLLFYEAKGMVLKKSFSALLLLTLFAQSRFIECSAQVGDPVPDRVLGAAEVYYFRDQNKSRSQVRIYLQGGPQVTTRKEDTISLDVIFEVEGLQVTKPKYARIEVSVSSISKSKYSKDHDFLIYTQGLEGINNSTWKTTIISSKSMPSGGIFEIFLSPPIEYSRILRLATAMSATVGLGPSGFELKQKDFQAIKDLNRTIEK